MAQICAWVASLFPRLVTNFVIMFIVLRLVDCTEQKKSPITYNFTSFESKSADNFTTLGDSSISKGALQITSDTSNPGYPLTNISGSILLSQPIRLWSDSGVHNNRVVASFNTSFAMNVFHNPDQIPGEGLTFVIAPSLSGPPEGSQGGYLGLTNASLDGLPSNRFVAVEFDTVKQEYDPDDNHCGLNIGSVKSISTFSLDRNNITVSPAVPRNYTVWIGYDGVQRHIEVYMGTRGRPRPAVPVLSYTLDISQHVNEESYLGFTASTGSSYELNCILQWEITVDNLTPSNSLLVWLLPAAAAAFILLSAVVLLLWCRMRRKRNSTTEESVSARLSSLHGVPRRFKYEELSNATRNFHEGYLLGKGGHGSVYLGKLSSALQNQKVAVKKFARDDNCCHLDSLAELEVIVQLKHKNIAPLIGWCYENRQLLLVYEYMPNGSLDKNLFRQGVHRTRPPLTWERRRIIIGDVAAALHYVHHEHPHMVVHRDIKCSNIMLDADYRGRLGDFGLARTMEGGESALTVSAVVGTRGYISPEYACACKASTQSDIYAFGVVILETVTGQSALHGFPAGFPSIVDWVWRLHGQEEILSVVDDTLAPGEYDADEAEMLLLLGLACCHPNPHQRPTMPEILRILSKQVPPPDIPGVKPAFVWPPGAAVATPVSNVVSRSSIPGLEIESSDDDGSSRYSRYVYT